MDRALTEKPVSQLAIARTLQHCHHYHLVQVAIGPPHLQIEYLWRLVTCNDVIRRPIKSRPLCYCSMFVFLLLYCNCYTQLHSPPPHIYTTTTCNHHHTVQVARVQVEYLRQWLEEKTPPAQVATGDDHHMCKWSICASCWKKKHHQRKLQQVLTTTCASGVFAPVDGGKHHQRKVQRSGPASGQIGAGCSNSSRNDNHHTTDQIRTSTGAVGVPDAAINATCVRAHHITSTCPNACCIDCCIRHSNGTRAGPDLVGGMVVVVA